jgi:hypothetical protein
MFVALPFTVYSFGGSGSKYLVKKICDELHLRDHDRYHSHERRPSAQLLAEGGRAIFVYGDPIDAVMSFFARRISRTNQHGYIPTDGSGNPLWAMLHCRNIAGRSQSINPNWDFETYLKQGEDFFDLESFMRNWLDLRIAQEILFVRYESMWRECPVIAKFMGFGHGFVERFGAPKERRSKSSDLDPQTLMQAQKIYGPVRSLLNTLPDAFVLSNGRRIPTPV